MFLFIVTVENHGAILRALIGALAVEFRGIVRDREENAQQFAVGDLRRIVDDLHGFGVSGLAGADHFIFGVLDRAARVAGSGADHTFHMLENRLDAPETATRHHRCLLTGNRGQLGVLRGRGNGCSGAGFGVAGGRADQQSQRKAELI